jgi:primosomal protein DnaI
MKDIKRIFGNSPDIDLTPTLKEVMQDAQIRDFLNQNHITDMNLIEEALPQLLSFTHYRSRCEGCKGLASCKQNIRGFQPVLEYGAGIEMIYDECLFLKKENDAKKRYQNLTFYSFDNLSINDKGKIYVSDERSEVITYLLQFVKTYKKDKFMKGLYMHGAFGVGKTYMLIHIAKQLAENGHKVIFAYYPNLVRELKSSIGNKTLESMVSQLKETDILILDDIGGESNSAFIRDEVLGPILQYRMDTKKPAFFTSNLSLEQLTEHFASVSNSIDRAKASRLIERIKAISVDLELDGKNFRD